MTNHKLQTSKEVPPLAKRKRVLSAVAQDLVASEDDDNVDDMDICDIIESHSIQRRESATSHALHALGETIRNTLLKINEVREQNRERRHKELLEVLTKMTQHDSAESEKTELLATKIHNTTVRIKEENNANDYITKENVSDKQQFNSTVIFKSTDSTTTLRQQELNLMHENTPSIAETVNTGTGVSPVHIGTSDNSIKVSPAIVVKGQKTNTVKAKHDSKAELQKMRAQLLEVQRKKMEDRERKKKEMQHRLKNV